MWYENENGSSVKPEEVDLTSSKKFAYVRRNFVLVEEEDKGGQIIPEHWRWEEIKIPKEVWDVCEKVMGHDAALDDVYAALTELAEMIVEG